MSIDSVKKLLETDDTEEKIRRVVESFEKEFGVLPTTERISVWLHIAAKVTSILIGQGVEEEMRDRRMGPDIATFFASVDVSHENCANIFSEMVRDMIRRARFATMLEMAKRVEKRRK